MSGAPVRWASADSSVARFSSPGLVVGTGEGITTISATSEGHVARATVAVSLPVALVIVSPPSVRLVRGASVRLSATVLDTRGRLVTQRPIQWSLSDSSLATIDSAGRVRTSGAGSVVARASSGGQTGGSTVDIVVVRYIALGIGFRHTCGVAADSTLYCWGYNADYELGTGTSGLAWVPTISAAGLKVVAVALGDYHSCALTAAGRAYCWGDDEFGQLGSDSMYGGIGLEIVPVDGAHEFVALTAGQTHTCGLTASGAAWCWGYARLGQVGGGDTLNVRIPAPVAGSIGFESLTAGSFHTCGIAVDSSAFCWGADEFGQLGGGTVGETCLGQPCSLEPFAVGTPHKFTALAAGGDHTCGLTSGGEIYCWGRGRLGQLGTGDTTDAASPVPVTGGLRFVAVSARADRTCAIAVGGSAYCWGNWTLAPEAVPGSVIFSAIAVGQVHACGISDTKLLLCWGSNSYGVLGDDGTSGLESTVPVRVTGQD